MLRDIRKSAQNSKQFYRSEYTLLAIYRISLYCFIFSKFYVYKKEREKPVPKANITLYFL